MFCFSGIVHTGYDALPGSIEWQCLKTSQQLNQQYYHKYNVPYKQIGAMIVAWDEKQVGSNLPLTQPCIMTFSKEFPPRLAMCPKYFIIWLWT